MSALSFGAAPAMVEGTIKEVPGRECAGVVVPLDPVVVREVAVQKEDVAYRLLGFPKVAMSSAELHVVEVIRALHRASRGFRYRLNAAVSGLARR